MPHQFRSLNPANGEIFAHYNKATDHEIDAALTRAERAFRAGLTDTHDLRAERLIRLARLLEQDAKRLASLAANEMGKPIRDGQAEVLKCAALCRFYADEGEKILAPQRTYLEDADVHLIHQPLGTIFSITPWNFPFWQILRAAIPAIIAGNTVLNKPAPNVIGCALELVKLVKAADFPEGILETINTDNDQSATIIKDRRIKGVTLTGSEKAGASVAATAGSALRKSVLELGGSDPFIVLKDADLKVAADAAARARFSNAGQVCIAAKRFLIDCAISDDFVEAFAATAQKYGPADPQDMSTMMGPMARGDLREELNQQALKTISLGADIIERGGLIDGPGFFYSPTILRHASPDSPARTQETFGPLAVIIDCRDETEIISIANETVYGLSSSVWSQDEERALSLAKKIEAGGVFINTTTASDPRFPFGGIERSGYGRELGAQGVYEFCNLKTVRLQRAV